MKMKTIFIYLFLTISIAGNVFSQEKNPDGITHEQKREKIKAQKIAFITNCLDLTPAEAQTFWPIYNEYNKKLDEISFEKMKIMKEVKTNTTDLSEKEAEVLGDKIVEFEVSEATLLKEYHAKFKKTLPKNKILKLYQTELKFKKQLLRDMKGKHRGKWQQGRNTTKE